LSPDFGSPQNLIQLPLKLLLTVLVTRCAINGHQHGCLHPRLQA